MSLHVTIVYLPILSNSDPQDISLDSQYTDFSAVLYINIIIHHNYTASSSTSHQFLNLILIHIVPH
jgi:hypothetical protein